jgi:membrane protease YdiL (CAAX protease family)
MTGSALLAAIILAWAVANGLPHLFVYALARRSYHQLSTLTLVMLVENGIMLLNLGGALVVAWAASGERAIWQTLGWRLDVTALFWGLAGLAAMTAWSGIIGRVTPRQISYGPMSARCGRGDAAFAAASLFLLPALCEESMFRGLIQGEVGRLLGPAFGIAAAALLYGLRHLPADLHWARVHRAGTAGWLNRILDLYGGAVILGLARHLGGSTFAPWIAHQGLAAMIARKFLPATRARRPGASA